MGLKAGLFNEDIDLTGGSAAVASALAAGVRGGFVVDGDSLLAPNSEGMHIVGVISGTETAAIEGSTLTIDGYPRSPLSLGGTYVVPLHVFQKYGLKIPVGARADLDWLGYDHAAACQEFASVIVDDPGIGDPWEFTPKPTCEQIINVTLPTAARVADTQSGHTDICGRANAYTDAQTAIPNRAGIDIYILEVTVRDVAGYSGIGFESPAAGAEKEVCNLDFPTLATVDTTYNMQELFGGAMHCTAQAPINMYGYGVGAGANAQTNLLLGVNGL